MVMFKTVLFPVDRSREARQAAEMVTKLMLDGGGQLYLLSVVAEDEQAMSSPELVAQILEEARVMFTEQGIATEAIERAGKPAFTICDVADEVNADLIVMGSRGLGLTDGNVQDSVTSRVISLSPCPVLVVP
jgi:nucleotide-binding universal stress UspA family protein